MAETAAATTKPTFSNEGAKITLHWLEKSRSQRILQLLEDLSIPYTIQTHKRGSDMLAGPDLKKVHPLGKSPVIVVEAPGAEPRTIAESALIVEYLCDYWGPQLVPTRWKPGMEGKIAGETDEWLRYRFFMHYAEGSLMTLLVIKLIMIQIKEAPVPFFIKPITRTIAGRVESQFLNANFDTHFGFIEQQLASSGGDFLCGKNISGADFMMIYPLESALGRVINDKAKYPNIYAYVDRMHARPSHGKAVQKIKDETGDYNPNF